MKNRMPAMKNIKRRDLVAHELLTSGKYRAKVERNRKRDAKNTHKED